MALFSWAQPGRLDSSFADQGRLRYQDPEPGYQTAARCLLQRADGRWLAIGERFDGSVGELLMLAYQANGHPDSSWADQGQRVMALPGLGRAFPTAATLAPDGGCFIAGQTPNQQGAWLLRLRPGGRPDSNWAQQGLQRQAFGLTDQLSALHLRPDGCLLVGGVRQGQPTAWAFDALGRPDSSFGPQGRVALGQPGEDGDLVADSLGNFFLAGADLRSGLDGVIRVGKFRPDGRPDSSFGQQGQVALPATEYANRVRLALRPDGRVVLAADDYANLGSALRLRLMQLQPDGSLDPAFGQAGQTLALPGAEPYALLHEPDGHLLVCGLITENQYQDLFVARFQPDGQPDSSFGSGGYRRSGLAKAPFQQFTFGRSLALTPHQQILAAGGTFIQGQSHLLVLRLTPGFAADTTTAHVAPPSFSPLLPYPNPTNGLLHLPPIASGPMVLELWSPTGQCLRRESYRHAAPTVWDLSPFPPGVYGLHLYLPGRPPMFFSVKKRP